MSWWLLWTVVFFAAFGAFIVISALVAVRGLAEVRALFSGPSARPPDERETAGPTSETRR
jgi:hypothetical protein